MCTDLYGPLQVYAVFIRLNKGGLYKVLYLIQEPEKTGDYR